MTISTARRLGATLAVSAVLAGCSAQVVSGTGGRARPGETGSVGLSVRWKAQVGGGIGDDQLAGGSADASRVYIDNDSGHVVALDAGTGKVAWRVRPGTRTGTPVGIADGVVLYYDSNDGLTALDGASGRSLWKGGRLGGNSDFAIRPAFADGIVALPAEKGYTDGLGGRDLRTGALRWLSHSEDYIDDEVAPVVAHGAFFAVRRALEGSAPQQLLQLDPTSGRTVWSTSLTGVGRDDEVELAASGDTVVVQSQGEDSEAPVTLTAFDARSHSRRWTSSVPDLHLGGSDAPLAAGGTLAFGTVKGLRGVSLASGKVLYTKQLDGGPADDPGLCQNQLCSVGLRVLTVVNPSGATIGEFHEPDDPNAATAKPLRTSAGRTYLVNASNVYALG